MQDIKNLRKEIKKFKFQSKQKVFFIHILFLALFQSFAFFSWLMYLKWCVSQKKLSDNLHFFKFHIRISRNTKWNSHYHYQNLTSRISFYIKHCTQAPDLSNKIGLALPLPSVAERLESTRKSNPKFLSTWDKWKYARRWNQGTIFSYSGWAFTNRTLNIKFRLQHNFICFQFPPTISTNKQNVTVTQKGLGLGFQF